LADWCVSSGLFREGTVKSEYCGDQSVHKKGDRSQRTTYGTSLLTWKSLWKWLE